MPLSNYSDLQASIARTLVRTDLGVDIPDFIALFEAQANRALKDAKVTARATATITDEYSAVPLDFAGVVTFDLDTQPSDHLEGVSAFDLDKVVARYWRASGKPRYYSVVGSEFRYIPVPDGAYSGLLTYYQRVPALSDANPTNWLLTNHPDAYLYGACLQSAPRVRADDRAATWAAFVTSAMDTIITDAERVKFGSRPAARARNLG